MLPRRMENVNQEKMGVSISIPEIISSRLCPVALGIVNL